MRIDKFLKVSRIIKRRTVAGDACKGNKVSVNGAVVKPSYNLKVFDVVQITFMQSVLRFRVLALNTVANKEQAESMYEIF